MHVAEVFAFVLCPFYSCDYCIANLAAIHLFLSQLINMIVDTMVVNPRLADSFRAIQKIAPDLPTLNQGGVLIPEGELNTGFEGFVKSAHAVGIQNQNA